MKKIIFIYLFLLPLCLIAGGIRNSIPLHKKGSTGGHIEFSLPDVEPTVYYDNDEREITIVGTGFASYYDVVISSVTTSTVYIFTCVNGTYDTIDVSSLPNDNYVITLDPPVNVSFEGYFSVY